MSTNTFFTIYGLNIFPIFPAKIDEHFLHYIHKGPAVRIFRDLVVTLGVWTFERLWQKCLSISEK